MAGYNGTVFDVDGFRIPDMAASYENRASILTYKDGDIRFESPIVTGDAYQRYDSFFLKSVTPQITIGCVDVGSDMIIAYQSAGSGDSINFMKVNENGNISSQFSFPLPSGYTTEETVTVKAIDHYINSERIVICVGVFDSMGDEYPCLLCISDNLTFQAAKILPDIADNVKMSENAPEDWDSDRLVISNGFDLICFDLSLSIQWTKTLSTGSETGTIAIKSMHRMFGSPDESFLIVAHSTSLETHLVCVSDVNGNLLDAKKVPNLPNGPSGIQWTGGSSFQLFAGTGTDGEYIVSSFVFEPTIARTSVFFYKTTLSGVFSPKYRIQGEENIVVGQYGASIGIGLTTPSEQFWPLVKGGNLLHACANRRYSNSNSFRSYCVVHENSELNTIQWTTLPFDIPGQFIGGFAYPLEQMRFGDAYQPCHFQYADMDSYFFGGFFESATTMTVSSGPSVTPSTPTFGTRVTSDIFVNVGKCVLNDVDANIGNFSIPQSDTNEASDSVIYIPPSDNRIVPRILKVIP